MNTTSDEINRALGSIDAQLKSIHDQLDGLRRGREKIGDRLDKVEKRQYFFIGGAGVIGAALQPLAKKLGLM